MPLYVYNLTGSAITLAASNGPNPVVPASTNPPNVGQARDVTGALKGLTSTQYTNLQAQAPGVLLYKWTDEPEFDTGALQVSSGNFPAFATNGSVLKQVGDGGPGTIAVFARLTQDDIDPGFAISASFSNTGIVEVGSSAANVVITASYTNGPPQSASTTDGTVTHMLSSPYTSDTLMGPYTSSVIGATQSFSITASHNGVSKTATGVRTYAPLMYYGISADGANDSAFIQALPSSFVKTGYANTYAIGAGGGTKKAYVGLPVAFGDPSAFIDINTGFAVSMSKVVTSVNVTNAYSVVIPFALWASDEYLSAAFSMRAQ